MRKAVATLALLTTSTTLVTLAMLVAPGSLLPRTRAAVMIALELGELIAQSDHIVVAHPESQSSRYVEGLIVTDVSLRVISTLKGSTPVGATLIATHLGGSVDRVGLSVPGAARFTPGRSAIVFLRRAEGSHELNVTGMSQGVMPIIGEGAAAQVQTGGDRATLMQKNASGTYVPAPSTSRHQALSTMVAEIERIVGATH
jgi:hypothetical protein